MNVNFEASQLVMSGGGVKGIAYVGALQVAQEKCVSWVNTAGVSAGAIVASAVGAGYTPQQMRSLLDSFEFEKVRNNEILRRLPIISEFKKYAFRSNYIGRAQLRNVVSRVFNNEQIPSARDGRFLSKLLELSSNNALYDGDYIEKWMRESLLKKGIKTFADLRGGVTSSDNPHGYRVRMTAVDAGRAKVVVLPYDMSYYGVNPDSLEVARAVRMSTSAPLIFKPVEFKYTKDAIRQKAYFIDGGIIDNFPTWLFNDSSGYPLTGMSLSGRRKYFAFDSPFNILKSVASIIYDFGLPADYSKLDRFINIDTFEVSTFDFDLDEREKDYLYRAGVEAANLALSHNN